MEDTRIMCSICGHVLPEEDVNIVDYEDDVCVECEKQYKG